MERTQRLGDRLPYRHARIERGQRVLENNLTLPPLFPERFPFQLRQIDGLQTDGTIGYGNKPEDASGKRGFSAAGFPDDPKGLACGEIESDAVDRLQGFMAPKQTTGRDGKMDR
jgi:hypothetical protein